MQKVKNDKAAFDDDRRKRNMGRENGSNSLLESELKKGMFKSTAPIALIMTILGLFIMISVGGYLVKYIRGPIPLEEVYGTEAVKNEYVTLRVQYVLDGFMETYRTRNSVRRKSDVYYLVLDEDLGAVPLRVPNAKDRENIERLIDETWDYLQGLQAEPPQGIEITGTMKLLKGDGERYYQEALNDYQLDGLEENYYLWAGLLDNQTPSSAMGIEAVGTAIALLGLWLLSKLFRNEHKKSIQAFLESHQTVRREDLEEDFRNAEKICGQFWIGYNCTYGICSKPEILLNAEISKVWFNVRKSGRTTVQELICLTADGKEHCFSMNRNKADQAIKRYQSIDSELAKRTGLRDKAMMGGTNKEEL